MKNLLIICGFLVIISSLSCKKSQNEIIQYETNSNSVISEWKTQLFKTASENKKTIIETIEGNINYSEIHKLKINNNQDIILFNLQSENSGIYKRYLGIIKNTKGYFSVGVYKVTSWTTLETFLLKDLILPGNRIQLDNLDGSPNMEWEKTSNEKSLFKIAQTKKGLNGQGIQSLSGAKSFNVRRLENISGCDEQFRTDWYWVVYDIYTGEIEQCTFLYSTCANGASGDGAKTSEEVEQEINSSIYAVSEPEEIVDMGVTGLIRERNYHWKMATGFKVWTVKSHETGTHEYSTSENRWNWKTFEHNTVTTSGFWAGGTITVTDVNHMKTITPQYATMSVTVYLVATTNPIYNKTLTVSKDLTSSIVFHVNY